MAQTFYETVAVFVSQGKVPNTLLLVNPASPYVCVGYHQDPRKEVDLTYCQEQNYPLIRRSQGGGAVYLDENQLFYQVITRTKEVPADITRLFETYLQAPITVLRKLGIQAVFKPINDILANTRKISGNGAGIIENATVMVGNILLDVNATEMTRVLRVPSEKFRDKLATTIEQWVTSLNRELQSIPPRQELVTSLTHAFETILGNLVPSMPTPEEQEYWETVTLPHHQSKEWLYLSLQSRKDEVVRQIKVYSNLRMVEVEHKAAKLISVTASVRLPPETTPEAPPIFK